MLMLQCGIDGMATVAGGSPPGRAQQRIRFGLAAIVLLLVAGPRAEAVGPTSAPGVQSEWNVGDQCDRKAIAKFPELTKESLVKRDADARQCRVQNHLPARQPLQPQSGQPPGGGAQQGQ